MKKAVAFAAANAVVTPQTKKTDKNLHIPDSSENLKTPKDEIKVSQFSGGGILKTDPDSNDAGKQEIDNMLRTNPDQPAAKA